MLGTGLGGRNAKRQLLAVGIRADSHAAHRFDNGQVDPMPTVLAEEGIDAGAEDWERTLYTMAASVPVGKSLKTGLPSQKATGSEAAP